MHIRDILAFTVCMLCFSTLSAQNADKVVKRSVEKYLSEYTHDGFKIKNCGLEKKRNNIIINRSRKKITIYANRNFAIQVFTPELVDKIYSDIKDLLPKEYRKYKIEIIAHRKPIEWLVPNLHRERKKTDATRMLDRIKHHGPAWVTNISRPYTPTKGLEGRHLALWQSHGRVFANDKQMWQWQRPALYCTTEDLFTQSIVVPFLMPMLENSGALIYTPRERDWQPQSVIVDNNLVSGASQYFEGPANKGAWQEVQGGFMPRDGYFVDHENPFAEGTSRLTSSSSSDKATALAKWMPEIPETGRYAVYVSYKSCDTSVPDAHYSVLHAGGVTHFRVNQQIGGGTWVYLGTFDFNAGAMEHQGVVLDNASTHKGVVSADAVRFGGGMGIVARGDSTPITSGLPRYLEGARYSLQWSGFPYEAYSPSEGGRDYTDDINSRSHALNHLSGGSVYNPDTTGLGVPIEISFGFHSDAGYSDQDEIMGTLGIVTTEYSDDILASSISRYISRDMAGTVIESIRNDIEALYGIDWTCRGLWDRSYSESRLPVVPSMILESLSHQNFMDMAYGHDPGFKFTFARAVYKALLKHLAFVNGEEYAVQPLPVKDFSVQFEGESNVMLSWHPVDDPLEPTATAKKYVLYTRVGNGGFDNGRIVEGCSTELPLMKDVQYSFKVAALNEGGESFPSEVLTAYISSTGKERVMIVNGFHRLEGPEVINTHSKAGFDIDADPGVPYLATPEYCGRQLDYERVNIGYEDGLGLSGNDFEGMLIAGNSFDYPYIHGKALAANGYSFVSCSSEALINGCISPNGYSAIDLILGVEKQGGKGSLLGYNRAYKSFPKELQTALTDYCNNGGQLFISGAHIASDMAKNDSDRNFIRNVLKVDFGGTVNDVSENVIFGSNMRMQIERTVNERCYAVPSPDILVPVDKAFISFVYNDCKESAGVAYAGKYRTICTSFPFEAIGSEEHRIQLMGSIMRFLLN